MTPDTTRHRLERLAQGALDLVVASLPKRTLKYLLTSICGRTGVSLIQVNGASGEILGAPTDRVVFGFYWRGLDLSAAVIAYLEKFFAARRGGTLIDIGANIGLFTIPLARNRQIACKLFEPDPLNYRLLCWNLANNCHPDNVSTYQMALLDGKAIVDLERSSDNYGDHRVRLRGGELRPDDDLFQESARATVKVSAAALDEILEARSLTAPIVVKIDAQGSEAHIVKGAAAVLSRVEILVLEFWPYALRRMNAPVGYLFEQLPALFRRACLLEERDWLSRKTTISDESFRPVASVISDLRKLYEDANSVEQVDLILCR